MIFKCKLNISYDAIRDSIEKYMKNPVVTFGFQHHLSPVGRTLGIYEGEDGDAYAEVDIPQVFLEAGYEVVESIVDDRGNKTYTKVNLHEVSIGFVSSKSKDRNEGDV